jgi:hypothetical protein
MGRYKFEVGDRARIISTTYEFSFLTGKCGKIVDRHKFNDISNKYKVRPIFYTLEIDGYNGSTVLCYAKDLEKE